MNVLKQKFEHVMTLDAFFKEQGCTMDNLKLFLYEDKLDTKVETELEKSTGRAYPKTRDVESRHDFREILALIIAFNGSPPSLTDSGGSQFLWSEYERKVKLLRAAHSRAILSNKVWRDIGRKAGRQLMNFIISHASLFQRQRNESYLLVSGSNKRPLPRPLATPRPYQAALNKRIDTRRVFPKLESLLDVSVIAPCLFGFDFPREAPLNGQPEGKNIQRLASLYKIIDHIKASISATGENPIKSKFRRIPSQYSRPVPVQCVAKYCTSCLRVLLPRFSMGSEYNWTVLSEKIARYLKKGLNYNLTLSQMTANFKLTETWLGKATSAGQGKLHQLLFRQFIYWVFRLVNFLLLGFCISSTSNGTPIYFKKHRWFELLEKQHSQLMNSLQPIQQSSATSKWMRPAKTFFVPKSEMGSVRAIVNLSQVNTSLLPVGEILKHLSAQALETPSIKAPIDIYPYISDFKQSSEKSQLYAVRTDIKNCFDAANTEKVYQILRSHLYRGESTFTLRCFEQWRKGSPFCSYVYNVQPKSNGKPQPLDLPVSKRKTILEERRHAEYDSGHISRKVEEVLTNLIIEVNQKTYRKVGGIPQGSTISTPLCDLLCQEFIRTELARFWGSPDCLLLRYIDDFLFVSTNRRLAERFLKSVEQPYPQYGITFSKEKTYCNFGPSPVKSVEYLGVPMSLTDGKLVLLPSRDLQLLKDAICRNYRHGHFGLRDSGNIDRLSLRYLPKSMVAFIKAREWLDGEPVNVSIEAIINSELAKLGTIFRSFHSVTSSHKRNQNVPFKHLEYVFRASIRSICRILLSLGVSFHGSRKYMQRFLKVLCRRCGGFQLGLKRAGMKIWLNIYKHSHRYSE